MNTKNFLIPLTLSLFCSLSAEALEWRVLKSCNDGALVIDQARMDHGRGVRTVHQVVLRDAGVIDYFLSKGIDQFQEPGSTKKEWIVGHGLPVSTSFSETAYPPVRNGSYNKWAAARVNDYGSSVKLSFYWLVFLGDEMREEAIADWTFSNCR